MINKALLELKPHTSTIDDVLEKYKKYNHLSFEEGIRLSKPSKKNTFIPSIRFATETDAPEIAEIFKDVYRGTYSYPSMEDPEAICQLIKDPNFGLVVFTLNDRIVIGCAGYRVNLKRKTGTIHGFIIRKEYQGISNLIQISIASLYTMLHSYYQKILVWGAEVRSGHTKSQYLGQFFGFLPLAFLPKKDYFYHREESEILYVLYDKLVLNGLRDWRIPVIPTNPQQYRCYYEAHKKLGLDFPFDEPPSRLKVEKTKVAQLRKIVDKKSEIDTYGNLMIEFRIRETESYLNFFHNTRIQNAERMTYCTSSPEELACLLEEVYRYFKENQLRYIEAFVSAYEVEDQLLFLRNHFKAMGYIPAYHYNDKTGLFGDQVVYVLYNGELNTSNLRMLDDSRELVSAINPNWSI